MEKIIAMVFLIFVPLARGQERCNAGQFEGFTESPAEHIIARLERAVVVRNNFRRFAEMPLTMRALPFVIKTLSAP